MSRNRLHVSKLEAFAIYCEGKGWVRRPTKGEYEVLRMTRSDVTLIVHTKAATVRGNAPVHLTLHGASEIMFNKWIREKAQ